MEKNIFVNLDNQVANVTISNTRFKNSMSLTMWNQLANIFSELSDNHDIRMIVLRGDGGNFCSGADISEFGQVRSNAEQVHHYEQAVDRASEAILHCPKPVIAAIDGYCIGGGLGLAMACDFRIATTEACLFIPAAKMSIVYGLRETQTLLALVGLSQAKRILYLGERIYADHALKIGLVDQVTALDDQQTLIDHHAEQFKLTAPLTIAGSKKILNQLSFDQSEASVKELLSVIQKAGDSEDYQEGRKAFAEKRTPVFKGR